MKSWYKNRMESGVSHRGQQVAKDKKVYLTDAQANLHNKNAVKLEKCEAPKSIAEAAIGNDYADYESNNSAKDSEKKARKAERQDRRAAAE